MQNHAAVCGMEAGFGRGLPQRLKIMRKNYAIYQKIIKKTSIFKSDVV